MKTASADVGEGPCWDSATGSLLWVDIHAGEVHREHLGAGTSVTDRGRPARARVRRNHALSRG